MLGISTLVYYTQQAIPAKVIGHPITTLFASGIFSLFATFILVNVKKSEKTFFQFFSSIFLLCVIVLSIGKNAGMYMANRNVNKFVTAAEDDIISEPKIFRNNDYGVSFNYPQTWEVRIPQRKATLILLYELNGSEATCNLSVMDQDMDNISDYDSTYFQTNLPRILSGVENVHSKQELINGKNVSATSYEFIIPTDNGGIIGSSLTITTLHKGKRFMLVINAPKDKLEMIKSDKQIIYESLLFE